MRTHARSHKKEYACSPVVKQRPPSFSGPSFVCYKLIDQDPTRHTIFWLVDRLKSEIVGNPHLPQNHHRSHQVCSLFGTGVF